MTTHMLTNDVKMCSVVKGTMLAFEVHKYWNKYTQLK